MEHKSKKYGIVILAIILLLGLSFMTYSQTNVESQKAVINSDSDTSIETLASVSKSTVILVACVILAGLLGVRRKKVK